MKKFVQLLVFSSVLLQSCTKNQENKLVNATTKTFRCALPNYINTIDVGKSNDSYTSSVLSQCFEGLMQLDEKGKIVPNLAKSVHTSEDGKTYTFYLKKGVKFHNGDQLTAQDFKWTFERNLNKTFNSQSAVNFLGDIVGVQAYQEGKTKEINGIKIIDPYTLQIQIKQPLGYFLHKLTYIATYVLNHRIAPKTEITQINDVIGTGPFKLVEYTKNSYIKFNAYTNYHDDKPNIANLEYFIIEDNTMLINKIKKGAIDFAEINVADVEFIRKEPNLHEQLTEITDDAFTYLELNPSIFPPLKNINLRLAIAYAIDREELVKEALKNNAAPTHHLIPEGIAGYRAEKGEVYFDVNRAKEFLKLANINTKTLRLPITVASKSPTAKIVAENISVQLRKNLNINVDIQNFSWGTYYAKAKARQIPIRYSSWGLDYPDPSNVLSTLFESKSSLNHCSYNNTIFDKFVKKADITTDYQERIKLYQQAEDILLEEAIAIPLYISKRYWWLNKQIKGVRYTVRGYMPHNKVIIYT